MTHSDCLGLSNLAELSLPRDCEGRVDIKKASLAVLVYRQWSHSLMFILAWIVFGEQWPF